MFKAELATFRQHLPELLKGHEGEFALIYATELSVFPSFQVALQAGFDNYGEHFLVKRIEARELSNDAPRVPLR